MKFVHFVHPQFVNYNRSHNKQTAKLCKTSKIMKTWPRGYKTFFMFNSAEHEIFIAKKYENADNSWQFLIF